MKTRPTADSYDENLIDAADRLLRAALRGRSFRLAVQCDICGAWLVDPDSVRKHRGPVCSKRIALGGEDAQ